MLAVDVVSDRVVMTDEFLQFVFAGGGVIIFEMGAAVVDALSVRSPEWEHLKFIRVVFYNRCLILLHVIGYQVALRIKDLNLIGGREMKDLMGHVCGIGDEW